MGKEILNEDDLLRLRLSVVFVRDKLTFLDPTSYFVVRLKHWFKHDYIEDHVKVVLNSMEEEMIGSPDDVMEIPEDFELTKPN